MKMYVRTAVALLLLAAAADAAAQNTPTPQPDAPPPAPPLAQPQQVTPAAPQPPVSTVPQSPPPPTYPPSQQSPPPRQYSAPPAAPPPPQPSQAPPQYPKPQWVHTDSSYPDSYGFHYHPFRVHVDGGGTITQKTNEDYLDNGWNVGAGFTWYPTSVVPLGIRIDGTYNHFAGRGQLLDLASAAYGTRVDEATEKVWGGDADLELDLPFTHYVHGYLLAGGGWYKQQNTYRQNSFNSGGFCFFGGCGGGGYYDYYNIVARNQSDWHFARNAGLGLEFAMGPRASFFVEARYMRIDPNSAKSDFLPIRAGLRF